MNELDQLIQDPNYAAMLGRDSLAAYAVAVRPDYQIPCHLDVIIQALEKVESGEWKRLIIQAPPRHGKSLTTTTIFPAWYQGKHPESKVMICCHTQSLASEFGYEMRELVMSEEHQEIFPDHQISDASKGKSNWTTTAGGKFFAAGIQGGATGRGSNLLVLDDPTKSKQEAASPVMRKKVHDFYTSVGRTRLQPDGRIIVISCMTGDTQVTMADGSYKPLSSIFIGDEIKAWDDGELVNREVINFASQGEDDIYEIRTGNHRVRANSHHPFLIEDGDGVQWWTKVRDLKPGMTLVACKGALHSTEPEKLTRGEAWLLGFMFGDGWITVRDTVQTDKKGRTYPRRGFVTCVAKKSSRGRNEAVLKLFKRIFGVVPKETKYGYRRTDIANIGRWFIERGLTGSSKTKRLPRWLFSQPISVRLRFLDGFVAADGHIATAGRHKGRRVVKLANQELVEDIRQLARGCGFNVTNVTHGTGINQPPNSPKPIEWHSWDVQWNPARNFHAFETATIRNIEPVGRAEVFDIQVAGSETFLADGLVSHNTRWHENDLIGWLLDPTFQTKVDDWHIVDLPAIAERDEGWRKEGEALWPAWYSKETLGQIKDAVGPWDWAAMFMQRPSAVEGRLIKRAWLKSYAWHPHLAKSKNLAAYMTQPFRIFQSWDTAFKIEEENDYSVCTTWMSTGSGEYLLDVWRGKMVAPDLERHVREMALEWMADTILIEEQAGHALIQNLRELQRLSKMRKVPIIGINPSNKGSKYIRLQAVSPYFVSGSVFVPTEANAPWLAPYVNELCSFPTGTHDDQVDSTSQYLNYIKEEQRRLREFSEAEEPMVDVNLFYQ